MLPILLSIFLGLLRRRRRTTYLRAALCIVPLVGALLGLRREAFLGVAVPQFSAAGLSLGLFLLPFFPAMTRAFLEHGHPPMLYMLPFATGGALLALAAFAWLPWSGHGAPAAVVCPPSPRGPGLAALAWLPRRRK